MVTLVVMGIRFSRPRTSINCIQNPFVYGLSCQSFLYSYTGSINDRKPSRCYRCLPNQCGKDHAAPIGKNNRQPFCGKWLQDRNDRQMASGRQCSTPSTGPGFQDAVWHRCGGVGQASDHWGNDYFDDTYERVVRKS